ncbi:MAG: C40 family peptidase [Casimicrobium sp.]
MLKQTIRYPILVVAALSAALSCTHATAAPSDDTNTATSTPLVRAEKSLRDLGVKAKDTASEITSYALSLIGVDYKFGGNSPEQGLDCSGLIRYVFQQATGISLPRTAREQARVGESVSVDKLQPGDLVFFNTRRFQFSHVGLYIGDNRFIHAPSTGGSVEVVSLDKQYWQKAFNGARRVIKSIPEFGLVMSPAEAAAPPMLPQAGAVPATTSENALSKGAAKP